VPRWFCPALRKMIRGQSGQAGDVSPKAKDDITLSSLSAGGGHGRRTAAFSTALTLATTSLAAT
jgi:hypothetical protein